VPTYWIVDADEHVVECWRPSATFPTLERDRLSWNPVGATRAFELPLAEPFRPI
jgi:hypothetical protein